MRGRPRLGRAVSAWAVVIAALSAATLALFGWVPREVPAHPPRALVPALAEDDTVWRVETGRNAVAEIAADRILLRAASEDPYALVHRPLVLPEGARAVRLEGEVRFVGRGGDEPHEAARIHLWAFDASGRRLPDRRVDLWRARRDRDWQRVQADLPLPAGAARAHLVVRLQGAAGELEVRRLAAAPLIPNPVLEGARIGLALSWMLGLLTAALLLWRAAVRRRRALLALKAGALGVLAVLLPPEAFALLPAGLGRALGLASSTPFLPHALLGAMLAFLVGRALPRTRPWPSVALVLLLAGAGEVLQLLSSGRQPALDDALANAAGGLVGLVLARLRARPEPAQASPDGLDLRSLPLVPYWNAQDRAATPPP